MCPSARAPARRGHSFVSFKGFRRATDFRRSPVRKASHGLVLAWSRGQLVASHLRGDRQHTPPFNVNALRCAFRPDGLNPVARQCGHKVGNRFLSAPHKG